MPAHADSGPCSSRVLTRAQSSASFEYGGSSSWARRPVGALVPPMMRCRIRGDRPGSRSRISPKGGICGRRLDAIHSRTEVATPGSLRADGLRGRRRACRCCQRSGRAGRERRDLEIDSHPTPRGLERCGTPALNPPAHSPNQRAVKLLACIKSSTMRCAFHTTPKSESSLIRPL